MRFIENEYDIGETVYLRTDTDQHARMVTAFEVRVSGITYELVQGSVSSWHYAFEMSRERDLVKSTES